MTLPQTIRAGAAVVLAVGGLTLMNSLGSLQLPSTLAYAGIVVFCAGVVTVLLPARWSGFSRRISGFVMGILIGGALFAAGWFWPARTTHVAVPATRLDAFMPSYDFYERHEIAIHAPAKRVREALEAISFADIGVMKPLGTIRAVVMGNSGTAQGGPPPNVPILLMLNDPHSAFFPLDDTGSEYVFGMAGQPWNNAGVRLKPGEFGAWARPDNVRIAFNFLLQDSGDGWSRVITETRVAANDESARRKMAEYWALVYPGSAMVRRSLLEAIRVRAEQS